MDQIGGFEAGALNRRFVLQMVRYSQRW